MADLSVSGGRSVSSDSRGQFLLLGAFGIAVFLLVFAGVLNAVTLTESLAVGTGDESTSRDVAAFQTDAKHAVEELMVRINNGSATAATKATRLDSSVSNWSEAVRRQYVTGVTTVEIEVADTDEGSLITQSTVQSLTNASGTGNWTVATGVADTRRFRMDLNTSGLVDESCETGQCYEMAVDDGTETWTVAMNRTTVTVDGPGGTDQCAVQSDPLTLDFTGDTPAVDGQACEALLFADGLSPPYDIRFRNGENATGTYELTVNASVTDDGDYAADGSPSVDPAIYATYLQVTYRTPDLAYANEIRIAEGEPDA
jgi:hypothetical protein